MMKYHTCDDNRPQKTIEGYPFKCKHCGHNECVYIDDHDNGDWTEACYKCAKCGRLLYVELAD